MKDTIDVLLDRLVVDRQLMPGSRLPQLDELATRFGYAPDQIDQALARAAGKGKFARLADGGFEVAVPGAKADDPQFSFSTTAALHHERLVTSILEPAEKRLPRPVVPLYEDDPRYAVKRQEDPLLTLELRAQAALGLAPDQPFLVVARVRHLNGEPRVCQRVYLDPARFKPKFIESHDLTTESLLDLYRQAGYRLLYRDTVLHARLPFPFEDNIMHTRGGNVHLQPVLHAEQVFFASRDGSSDGRFVLEFMQATYFNGWEYSIHNRPPEG